MKIQNRNLLLILIVLAVVTATIGMVGAIPGCSPGQIFPCGTVGNMKVTTDKLTYNQESLVNFTIKNAGTASVWVNQNPVTIKDVKTGNIVYDSDIDKCSDDVCIMSLVVPVQVEIKPGKTYKWTWDQKMNTGYACAAIATWPPSECIPPNVGSGRYQGSIHIYGNDGTMYNMEYNSNIFRIR